MAKIGHDAKAIAFTKWLLMSKIKFLLQTLEELL